jgi:hypothetical protein
MFDSAVIGQIQIWHFSVKMTNLPIYVRTPVDEIDDFAIYCLPMCISE